MKKAGLAWKGEGMVCWIISSKYARNLININFKKSVYNRNRTPTAVYFLTRVAGVLPLTLLLESCLFSS